MSLRGRLALTALLAILPLFAASLLVVPSLSLSSVGPLVVGAIVAVGGLFLSMRSVVARLGRLAAQARASAASGHTGHYEVRGKDEIAQVAKAISDASSVVRSQLKAIEKREQALRQFLENTTHDVMVPLSVVQGHLTTLKEHAPKDAPAPVTAALDQAMSEAHYLGSLLNNLSVAARIEAGEEQVFREEIDLNRIVERAVARHQPVAKKDGVELDHAVPETPTVILGDVTLVEQMVSNVVYNAIRHNKPGGHAAAALEKKDGQFVLRVFDDGPGVPEAELPKLRERYYRGNEARTRTHGRGIGLSITSQVAHGHGFQMELLKSEFGGLEIRFTGPLAGLG